MEVKDCRVMFRWAALFGFVAVSLSILSIIYYAEEFETLEIVVMSIVSAITFIVSIVFLIISYIKDIKKLYQKMKMIKTLCLLSIFGSIITLIFAWNGYRRLMVQYLVDNNQLPNMETFLHLNEEEPKKDDDVIDVKVEEHPVEEEKGTPLSMQEEIEQLNKKLEEGKITEDQFYQEKQKIMHKYYGN